MEVGLAFRVGSRSGLPVHCHHRYYQRAPNKLGREPGRLDFPRVVAAARPGMNNTDRPLEVLTRLAAVP